MILISISIYILIKGLREILLSKCITMELFNTKTAVWWFVNSDPKTKCPVDSRSKIDGEYRKLADWNGKKRKSYMADILPTFTSNYKSDLAYGIKLGKQPNGDYVIGLDFDIYGKTGDKIVKCDKTQELYDEFTRINPSSAGVWRSGTDGNYGCLVLVQEQTLFDAITDTNKEKHSHHGLELLFNTHLLLPPSPSKCKRTGTLRKRHLINPEKVYYELDSKDDVYDFIMKMLPIVKPEKTSAPPKVRKIIVKRKTPKKILQKEESISVGNTTVDYDPSTIEEEDRELADIISLDYISNYNTWLHLLWACKDTDDFDLAVYLSKRDDKYEENGLGMVHYKYNEKSRKGITKATFYYYANKSNPHLYQQIRKKYNINILKNTEGDLADLFITLYGQDHLLYGKTHYFYNGVFWEENLSGNRLKKSIRTELTKLFADELGNVAKDMKDHADDEQIMKSLKEKYNTIKHITDNINSYTRINNIYGFINTYIEKGDDEIEWENKPYYFAFKNKIYDLKEGCFTTPLKDDYITITTGYDWRSATTEEIKTLRNLLTKIFPHKDELRLYMTLLAQALVGETLEKFIMANGNGGNGKGVINELVYEMFGNYGYNCANNVLLAPLKQGSNPEVANMEYKRIIFYREPEENHKINVSTMKELTGGNEINARKNYSNKTDTKLSATHILECNKRPKLSGKVDNALKRRLIDIPFRSTFTATDPDEYGGDYVYKADKYFKSHEFKDKHKHALFEILLEYLADYLKGGEKIDTYMCASVVERTDRYLESNDELKGWFDTRYERTGNKENILQVKHVYEELKESDLWGNFSKREKREMSYKSFVEYLETNIHFKRFFKERVQNKRIQELYGVKQLRMCLVGYIEKPVIEDDVENDVED